MNGRGRGTALIAVSAEGATAVTSLAGLAQDVQGNPLVGQEIDRPAHRIHGEPLENSQTSTGGYTEAGTIQPKIR